MADFLEMWRHRPSIVERLFLFGQRTGRSSEAIADAPGLSAPADAPIQTAEEITDNRLLLEAMFFEFCDLAQVNPYELRSYSQLQQVIRGDRSSSYLVFQTGLKVGPLPARYKISFVEYIIRQDALDDRLSDLSQTKWENLREWAHA